MNDDEDDGKSKNYIKVILVGDAGVGKTNLIAVACGQEFNTKNLSTTTCSYMRILMKINDIEYKVNIWDTIGQEKYKALTKIFFKNSKIVLFVYDITSRKSFESLKSWKQTIDQTLGNVSPIGVVGNKCDLYMNEEVTESEAKKYAEEIGAKFIYTSAKLDAHNFKKFLEELVKDYVSKNTPTKNTDIKIDKKKCKEKKRKKFC